VYALHFRTGVALQWHLNGIELALGLGFEPSRFALRLRCESVATDNIPQTYVIIALNPG
jgi:hypothetical protein